MISTSETHNCRNCSILIKQCDQLRRQVAILEKLCDPPPSTTHSNNQTDSTNLVSTEFQTDDLQCQNTDSNPEQNHCYDDANISSDLNTTPLFSLYLENNKAQAENTTTTCPSDQSSMIPAYIVPGNPFSQFNVDTLDSNTAYSVNLSNRCVAYYGPHPYHYGNTFHDPNPLPNNSYISEIIKHVSSVLPGLKFNSVLLTKFRDGSDFIPPHSDDEECIAHDSTIATISLGATREISFYSVANGGTTPLQLSHGSMYCMTRKSQNLFKHAIPRHDPCSGIRISITLRFINPPDSSNPSFINDQDVINFLVDLGKETLPPAHDCTTQSYPTTIPRRQCSAAPAPPSIEAHAADNQAVQVRSQDRSTSVYISSSLFKTLDEKKLGSKMQDAKVFSYPGATAGEILVKLQNDKRFHGIDPNCVGQVFVLCGNNNVDKILNVPRSHWTSVIHVEEVQYSKRRFLDATDEIANLGIFLHEWSRKSTVNFINLLPRTSLARNQVINDLNSFIDKFCESHNHLNMVGTEASRRLFSDSQGYRKSNYFSSNGADNIHLAPIGISRLANHLKYIAHR